MNPKYYCPLCHGRIEKPVWKTTVWQGDRVINVSYFITNHTEPICMGHEERVPVPDVFEYGLEDVDLDV